MGNETVDLERFYENLNWPTRPDDPKATSRFSKIVSFATELFRKQELRNLLEGKEEVGILDTMAASGIAGVAFAKAIADIVPKISLTVTDIRESELQLAEKWLEIAGLSRDLVKLEIAKVDVTKLPKGLGERKFDLVISWGSSLPHLNTYDFLLFLAGARNVQSSNGILVIQQANLLPKILINNEFRRVLIEGSVLTIFKEYDEHLGVQRRLAYKLPSLEYLGVVETRLWEIAQIMSLLYVFYRNVETYDFLDLMRLTKVVVAYSPRTSVPSWSELYGTLKLTKQQ